MIPRRSCNHCGAPYRPRVQHQAYCATRCRLGARGVQLRAPDDHLRDFGAAMTWSEIGTALGMSGTRAEQIGRRALQKLAHNRLARELAK